MRAACEVGIFARRSHRSRHLRRLVLVGRCRHGCEHARYAPWLICCRGGWPYRLVWRFLPPEQRLGRLLYRRLPAAIIVGIEMSFRSVRQQGYLV
jgi:hypothetical protein